jgi:hypothetical protein
MFRRGTDIAKNQTVPAQAARRSQLEFSVLVLWYG